MLDLVTDPYIVRSVGPRFGYYVNNPPGLQRVISKPKLSYLNVVNLYGHNLSFLFYGVTLISTITEA